jgi:hypothetical protein
MPRPKFHAAEARKKNVCCTTYYRGAGAAFALLIAAFMAPASAAQCVARSGERTVALVELYTSEGCSSCPPADRWLSSIGRTFPPDRVVPLALHVDYWDYIGWKDPYARREFSQRQRRLSQLQRRALVYTPQVLVQGADFRAWGSSEFERSVARINAQPARSQIQLEIGATTPQLLRVRVEAAVSDSSQRADAALYVAAYENLLENRVTAGENRGRLLSHDHVALEWQGPYALGSRELDLPILPKAKLTDSGVVAFVQNRRTAEVLQALALPACAP